MSIRDIDNLHLLIIDDQPGVRMLLEETFKQDNFSVSTAKDAMKALEMLNKIEPDVIFVDFSMPSMDGISFAEKIKSEGYDGKIVLITGYEDKVVHKVRDPNSAVDDVLIKPFDIEDARNTVKKVLDRRKGMVK